MSLLGGVCELLDSKSVPFALVGAAALAIRGVSRSTFDLDLLTTDAITLQESTWDPFANRGDRVEVRRGDASDPLAGVVRITARDQSLVDVIVGRAKWQAAILRRATPEALEDVTLPVATAPDLVLLKLYAGGPQDLWDASQLLAGPDGEGISRDVNERVRALPRRCREAWSEVTRANG